MSEEQYDDFDVHSKYVNGLEQRITELEANNKDFRTANEIISSDNILHEQRIAELEADLADWKQTLEETRQTRDDLSKKCTEYRKRIAELENRLGLSRISPSYASLLEDNSSLKQRIAELEEFVDMYRRYARGEPIPYELYASAEALLARGGKE